MAAQGCASLSLLHIRRAWRRSAACRCPRLPAGSRVLRVLCTDRGVYERVCSARAAKDDSLYDLLAAGRAAVLLPPGQRLSASGNTSSWTILGVLPALELTPPHTALALCTSTRGRRTNVHHYSQCWSFAHYRSAYRRTLTPAATVAATAERRAARV